MRTDASSRTLEPEGGETHARSIDIGFSPSRLGMDIQCRPAVELLAIVGLETVPLVSFGPRDCGFLHGGCVWRFTVEQREGEGRGVDITSGLGDPSRCSG